MKSIIDEDFNITNIYDLCEILKWKISFIPQDREDHQYFPEAIYKGSTIRP